MRDIFKGRSDACDILCRGRVMMNKNSCSPNNNFPNRKRHWNERYLKVCKKTLFTHIKWVVEWRRYNFVGRRNADIIPCLGEALVSFPIAIDGWDDSWPLWGVISFVNSFNPFFFAILFSFNIHCLPGPSHHSFLSLFSRV